MMSLTWVTFTASVTLPYILEGAPTGVGVELDQSIVTVCCAATNVAAHIARNATRTLRLTVTMRYLCILCRVSVPNLICWLLKLKIAATATGWPELGSRRGRH